MSNDRCGHVGERGYVGWCDCVRLVNEGRVLVMCTSRSYCERGPGEVWWTRDTNRRPTSFTRAIVVSANPATAGVSGGAAGAPICRSTLADPGNGCVPINIFGEGALGAASLAWVTGLSDGYRPRQDLAVDRKSVG